VAREKPTKNKKKEFENRLERSVVEKISYKQKGSIT
jgi:hypothetical protein